MPQADNAPQTRWYFKPVAVIVAILIAGPFAIPLVWLSPSFKRWQKIALTIAVIVMTAWTIKASMGIYQQFLKDLQELQKVLQ